MKKDTHPTYKDTTFTCACGAVFTAGSTISDDEFKTEICSKCHPFYTGKQKLVDTSGRVDKFVAKMKKAQALKDKDVKEVEEEETTEVAEEIKEETPEVIEETPEETPEEAPEVAEETPEATEEVKEEEK